MPNALLDWLLARQHRAVHPYTASRPGGWAWTDLAGGVPDADDTAGALLAIRRLGPLDEPGRRAGAAGVRWLLDLQNRDGGVPTFCRGWGTMDFDRSGPDLTAHALLAWHAWRDDLPAGLARRTDEAMTRALAYLHFSQRSDGAWLPLWFGNQQAKGQGNPTYGTARVLIALAAVGGRLALQAGVTSNAVDWLRSAQNGDGGWGGDAAVPSTMEETAVAVCALAGIRANSGPDRPALLAALDRGVAWLVDRVSTDSPLPAAPIGLYFARLWYGEKLYPIIFPLAALRQARAGELVSRADRAAPRD